MSRRAANANQLTLNGEADDMMRAALAMCESGRLEYVSATCCRMRIAHTAPGDTEWWVLDLTNYRLPATRLTRGCSLAHERRLAVSTILAADAYLCKAGHEKATHRTLSTTVSTIAKIWEWGRLNGIYRPEDWTTAHFRQLELELAEGKWSRALQARDRVLALLATKPDPKAIGRTDAGFAIRRGISQLLGTNQGSQELSCARQSIHRYVQAERPPGGWDSDIEPKKPTTTWLVQAFWSANLLVRVPTPYAFKVTPFPEPLERAKKLAKPNSRTKTLSVEQAVGLLLHARKYIHEYTDVVVDLVREVGRIAQVVETTKRGKNRSVDLAKELWCTSSARAKAESTLGVQVVLSTRAAPLLTTVPGLVDNLMTAAVILIAGLNARRKHEVTHRTLGLKRDAMGVVNEELEVYEGTFYIEKTLQSYAPYFVNRSSYDAFLALRRLEEAQLEVERLLTGRTRSGEDLNHSMFWARKYAFSRKAFMSRVWFEFSLDRKGSATGFCREALGPDNELNGSSAHIFRRFYAIIFFYRFEHGGLLALRYQLAHFNCETTRQYVTDAMIQAAESRIPIEIRRAPDDIRAAIASEWHDIEIELQKVGSEKLGQMILDLLREQRASGGFPRLVARLHRRLMAEVDYSAMDTARRAKYLRLRIEARGHAIRPLPHADCAAGSSPARGARCALPKGSGPAPENATASICSACAYSWTTAGHLAGQRMDLEMLDREIASEPPDTLVAKQRRAERVNLERAIWLHEQRLEEAPA